MSGDVQPRKRKDKKKKKDEPPPPPFVYLKEEPPVVLAPSGGGSGSGSGGNGVSSSPDELIHIYKESRLGGNICAKIVFFLLLGTLAVMVGFIITEYRGSEEVQTATDSPWSKMLEGWVDNFPPEHDSHDLVDSSEDHDVDHGEEGDGNEEPEEHEEHDDHEDEEHDDEEEEEEQDIEPRVARDLQSQHEVSYEQDEDEDVAEQQDDVEEEDEEEEEEEEEDKRDVNDGGDKDNGGGDDGEENGAIHDGDDDDDEEEEDNGDNDEEEKDDLRIAQLEDNDESVEADAGGDDIGEEQDDQDEDNGNLDFLMHGIPGVTESTEVDDDENVLDEKGAYQETHDEHNVNGGPSQNSEEQDQDDIGGDNNDHFENQSNEHSNEESSEQPTSDNYEDKSTDDYEEFMVDHEAESVPPMNDDGDDGGDQVGESDEFEEVGDTGEATNHEEEGDESLEPTGVALKFGVGIAIIIVAHVVLVRKWNESDEQGSTTLQPTTSGSPAVVPRRQTLIPLTTDPSSLLPEPDDVEDYSDEEDEEEEDVDTGKDESPIHAKLMKEALIRKYGKLTPEASEEEDGEEEEEEDDVEYEEEDEEEDPEHEFDKQYGLKYTTPSNRQHSEEGEEDELGDEEEEEEEEEDYGVHEQQWKSSPQQHSRQSSDPEVSDADDLSGSEGESPPLMPPKRTSGHQEHSSEWPMGPDYPSDQSVESSPKFASKLEDIEAHLEENPDVALKEVSNLLTLNPTAPRLLFLRARAQDRMAEIERSNKLLEEAISSYSALLQSPDIDDTLYQRSADLCINRMRFRGQHSQAIGIHKQLISRFPNDPKYRNDLAITYLMMGKVVLAKQCLEETLKLWPKDGVALVHYGFILKVNLNKNQEGAFYLQAGIDTQENGTIDARFFFHLGDAYNRIGLPHKANEIYELGVQEGMFRSKYQRSLYNVDHLTARPWWSLDQTTYEKYLKIFEDHWHNIKKEALAILQTQSLNAIFQDEAENLREVGDWKQLELYTRGRQIHSSCQKAPLTCQLISQFPAARTCRRGQAKFSVMHPGTHVWPHCGPTNCRLRAHLGLVVPPGTEIRVASEKRSWKEGKIFVFDDSFEHEVWHNGSSIRLVLIVDFWHPDLTEQEKQSLPSI